MSDVDIALAGAIGSMLGDDGKPDDAAIRKWFESLPQDTQARLLPLNPQVAESLMRTGNGHIVHGDMEFNMPRVEPHPSDGHAFDGWAHDSNCVQCRRPEHEHRRPIPLRVPSSWGTLPPTHIRTGGVFAIGLGMIFNFVGLVLQLPGRALVLVGEALTKWAVVEDE